MTTTGREESGDWPYRDLTSPLRPPGESRTDGDEQRPERLPTREELGFPPEEPEPARLPTREELGLPQLEESPEPAEPIAEEAPVVPDEPPVGPETVPPH